MHEAALSWWFSGAAKNKSAGIWADSGSPGQNPNSVGGRTTHSDTSTAGGAKFLCGCRGGEVFQQHPAVDRQRPQSAVSLGPARNNLQHGRDQRQPTCVQPARQPHWGAALATLPMLLLALAWVDHCLHATAAWTSRPRWIHRSLEFSALKAYRSS